MQHSNANSLFPVFGGLYVLCHPAHRLVFTCRVLVREGIIGEHERLVDFFVHAVIDVYDLPAA